MELDDKSATFRGLISLSVCNSVQIKIQIGNLNVVSEGDCWALVEVFLSTVCHADFIWLSTLPFLFPPGGLGLGGAPTGPGPSRAEPGDDWSVPEAQHRSAVRKLPATGGEPWTETGAPSNTHRVRKRRKATLLVV